MCFLSHHSKRIFYYPPCNTPAYVLTLNQCCASKEKYRPIGPGVYILCLQLVEQFAEVIEPIRCVALLEEVPRWGQAWRVYPLSPLPVLLLCLLYVFEMWSLGFLLLDAMSPCQRDTYYSGTLGQKKLFVGGGGGKMLWGQGFYCCKSKVLIVVLTLSDRILAMMFSMMMCQYSFENAVTLRTFHLESTHAHIHTYICLFPGGKLNGDRRTMSIFFSIDFWEITAMSDSPNINAMQKYMNVYYLAWPSHRIYIRNPWHLH